jgi:hypothetical protein
MASPFMSVHRPFAAGAFAALVCLSPLRAEAAEDPSPPEAPAPAPAPASSPAAPPVPEASPAAPPVPEASPASPPAPAPASAAPAVVEAPQEQPISLKLYGDSAFRAVNRGPVKISFETAHLDLFFTADVGKLSFLSEVLFEGRDTNEFAVDVERLQVAYLVDNKLRFRLGRSHTAFGYYSDVYHHGNLFELTTGRPIAVDFEDEGGLIPAHVVGAGADGTFDLGGAGGLRYDVDVGNGRTSDPSAVANVVAAKNEKMVNVRLRWITPVDGLLVGVNGLYDLYPEADAVGSVPSRPKVVEAIAGAHAVYTENDLHVIAEAYRIHHAQSGGGTFATTGAFAELGYRLGAFTPYVRPEVIRFAGAGDPVFQHPSSRWAGATSVFDLRVGLRWLPLPQLAVKLEGERFATDGVRQESVTTKVAFGF